MDNVTFYLPEFMSKPTEISKKIKFFGKKLQKIQVFGKKFKKKISKFSEKIAKNFKVFGTNYKFLERTAKILRFWIVFYVASDLIE